MTNDPLTKQELYIITDALIHYQYRWRVPSHTPQTKYKIKTIQKKVLQMEDSAND